MQVNNKRKKLLSKHRFLHVTLATQTESSTIDLCCLEIQHSKDSKQKKQNKKKDPSMQLVELQNSPKYRFVKNQTKNQTKNQNT